MKKKEYNFKALKRSFLIEIPEMRDTCNIRRITEIILPNGDILINHFDIKGNEVSLI